MKAIEEANILRAAAMGADYRSDLMALLRSQLRKRRDSLKPSKRSTDAHSHHHRADGESARGEDDDDAAEGGEARLSSVIPVAHGIAIADRNRATDSRARTADGGTTNPKKSAVV